MYEKFQSLIIIVSAIFGGTAKGITRIPTLLIYIHSSPDSSITFIAILKYLAVVILTAVISGIFGFITTLACKYFFNNRVVPFCKNKKEKTS